MNKNMDKNVVKAREEKKEREKEQRKELANQIIKAQESGSNLPAIPLQNIKDKVQEVSEYIELNLKNGNDDISITEITPLIARKSIREIATGTFNNSYTPEELAIAFNYYIDLMAEVNKYIDFPPSKVNFCQLVGISTATYNNYLADPERADIMQVIDDYIANCVINGALLGKYKEISSIFITKAQHKWVEATAPQVVIHEKTENIDDIKAKFEEMKRNATEATFIEKEP